MLSATNLSKRYNDVIALDALNLTVAAGEVFCLLGANGAGKTTTINLFLNFIEPTSGTRDDQRHRRDAAAARDQEVRRLHSRKP